MQGIKSGPPTLLPLLLALAACAAPRTNQQAAQLYQGEYTIAGSVAGTAVNAMLSFNEQNFYFESNHGSCTGDWPRYYKPTSMYINFGCGALKIRFTHEGGRFTDRALATITRTEFVGTKRECVLWDTNPQGRRTCIRYMDMPVERTTQKDGYVSVASTQ